MVEQHQDGIREYLPWRQLATPGKLIAGVALIIAAILLSQNPRERQARRSAYEHAIHTVERARQHAEARDSSPR